MYETELIGAYRDSGSLLEGHFLLRSGMHSNRFLQSAIFLSSPERAHSAGVAVAELVRDGDPTVVVSPAVGGIVIGHETARALEVPALFAERVEDRFVLRRGFHVGVADRVVIVEDIVTTGGSIDLVADMIAECGAQVIGAAAIVDRSGGRLACRTPLKSVARLEFDVWSPEKCPLCRQGTPISKPGSRGVH